MRKIVFSFLVWVGSWGNAQQLLEVLKSSKENIPPISLPPNVKLGGGTTFIASIYDSNYLPYQIPTAPADWSSDGPGSDKLVDYQGTITETGQKIQIPITVTGDGITTIPAYTTTPITIPAEKTEDGQSRQIVISWEEQTNVTNNTKYITATLKTTAGTLNVKKLDINRGLGNDYRGVLLGSITYPSSSIDATATGTYEIRAISGIPDRNFGKYTREKIDFSINDLEPNEISNEINKNYGGGYFYNLIYLPIEINGKIWLNNNLGANYSRITHEKFNPIHQAFSKNDYNAYGNLYQWQRPADGHEIRININSMPIILHPITGITRDKANSWKPDHNKMIQTYGDSMWTNSELQENLWKKDGENNPCPFGFHVPSKEEWDALSNDDYNLLNLPYTGFYYDFSSHISPGLAPSYWTSTILSNNMGQAFLNFGHRNYRTYGQTIPLAVRCTQD